MRYLLDTTILIYLLKHKPPSIARRVSALPEDDELWMSFITFAELLKGAERSTQRSQVLRRLVELTRVVPVNYSVGQDLCEHYAIQFQRLRSAGTPIGGNDLWIACHALAEDAVLVTNNLREFQRIEGLRLENWAE